MEVIQFDIIHTRFLFRYDDIYKIVVYNYIERKMREREEKREKKELVVNVMKRNRIRL